MSESSESSLESSLNLLLNFLKESVCLSFDHEFELFGGATALQESAFGSGTLGRPCQVEECHLVADVEHCSSTGSGLQRACWGGGGSGGVVALPLVITQMQTHKQGGWVRLLATCYCTSAINNEASLKHLKH